MEDSVWQIGIIALVAGILIGGLAHRLMAPSIKQAARLKGELDEARRELGRFRDNVNQHFDKTSRLVNDLTRDYVQLYRHLEGGARDLGDGKAFEQLLDPGQSRLSLPLEAGGDTPAAGAAAAAPIETPAPAATEAETDATQTAPADYVAAATAPEPSDSDDEPDGTAVEKASGESDTTAAAEKAEPGRDAATETGDGNAEPAATADDDSGKDDSGKNGRSG